MLAFSIPRARGAKNSQGGFSLTWILLPSVVLVMVLVFMAVQLLGIIHDTVHLSLEERMDPARLASEAAANFPLIGLIVVLMIAGILVALRIGLRPLRRVSELAARIGPATISQRLPLELTPREIAPLVIAFNDALDRLEAGLRAQREFSSNAAHELRTPLATLRAQVESVLRPEERGDAMEEFERLGRLITQLLALAEAEDRDDLSMVDFDLVERARTLTSEMASAIVAGGRGIAFESDHEHWSCRGSPGLVEVAIRNLLENAARHTPVGCEILVSLDASGRLNVSDDGPGVPERLRGRLFKRFSKGNAHGLGAGLGLSIVSRVMALHGGDAVLVPSASGAHFALTFPECGHEAQSKSDTPALLGPWFRSKHVRPAGTGVAGNRL